MAEIMGCLAVAAYFRRKVRGTYSGERREYLHFHQVELERAKKARLAIGRKLP